MDDSSGHSTSSSSSKVRGSGSSGDGIVCGKER